MKHSMIPTIQSEISDQDYAAYVEDARKYRTRWDYLRHYNILDVVSMISPLDNIITFTWEKNVDALRNLSLSANASAIKYALCYKDFDINADYSTESTLPTFKLTPEFWKGK